MKPARAPLAGAVWGVLRLTVGRLQNDPSLQYKFHRVMTWVWFVAMVGFTLAWFVTGGFGSGFVNGALWLLFFTLWVSLYANFATDYDAMSASLAAIDAEKADAAVEKEKQ